VSRDSFETLLSCSDSNILAFFLYKAGNWSTVIGCWFGPLSWNGSQSPGNKKLLHFFSVDKIFLLFAWSTQLLRNR
jgi:hypothetical protein